MAWRRFGSRQATARPGGLQPGKTIFRHNRYIIANQSLEINQSHLSVSIQSH